MAPAISKPILHPPDSIGDESLRSSSDIRRAKLRSLIQRSGFSALGELAQSLSVSESTIRRDLELLEQTGDVRRTHGGVFWTGESASIRAFEDRTDSTWLSKAAIGRAASRLVDENDTILLDGGSTTYELARCLVGRRLQVVTNSLPVAHLLSSFESIDLVMIGGCVRGRTAVAIGPLADEMIRNINVRTAFLSVAGVNRRGFFNDNMMLVESEKAMMASADRSFVVADHSKFGRVSLSHLCRLDEVDGVVSDSGLTSDWKSQIENAGIDLVLADPQSIAESPSVSPTAFTDPSLPS